jgi:dolichyl-phosphate-mannose--protein O-mannosyl transferase
MLAFHRVKTSFNTADTALVFLLGILSTATHLWLLPFPDCVVFDEAHFGKFMNGYSTSIYFFDIHPPLGKLVMFLVSNFSQNDCHVDFEAYYGQQLPSPDNYILRVAPAVFSSLCSPLIYLAMRFSSFSMSASFLSAYFVVADTSLLTEHRFTLSDGLLHFFCSVYIAYFSYFLSLGPNSDIDHLLLGGLLLGCACACKNTAWGLLLYTAYCEVIELFQLHVETDLEFFEDLFFKGFVLFLIVLLVHFFSFAVHLSLLPFTGPGASYLPDTMKAQLIDPTCIETQLRGRALSNHGTYVQVVALAVSMHMGNMGIVDFHPYMSRPRNWPLLTGTFVGFWIHDNREVDCIGNVFVYYIAFFALFAVSAGFRRPKFGYAIRTVVGWLCSYLPFFLIPRSMYLYHYHIPLLFGCMAVGAAADIWLAPIARGPLITTAGALVAFGFWLWSPLSYGTPHLEERVVIWNENWRWGYAFHRELARGRH